MLMDQTPSTDAKTARGLATTLRANWFRLISNLKISRNLPITTFSNNAGIRTLMRQTLLKISKQRARTSTDRATGFCPVGWGFKSLRARAAVFI